MNEFFKFIMLCLVILNFIFALIFMMGFIEFGMSVDCVISLLHIIGTVVSFITYKNIERR